MLFRDDYRRLLRTGGFAVWLAVGLPVLFFQVLAPPKAGDGFALAVWLAVLLLFGAAFGRATARRAAADRPGALLLLAGKPPRCSRSSRCLPASASRARCSSSSRSSWEASCRARPPRRGSPCRARAAHGSCGSTGDWHWGVVLAFAYLPFQLIAVADDPPPRRRDRRPRALAAANAELEATRELLARSARLAERARIARDLHDLLGHHLTALSLNLEIASHGRRGGARARVETAQSVTKLLLGDVRASWARFGRRTASTCRPRSAGSPTAFRGRASTSSFAGLSRSTIRPVGEVVLRCAQEIVTNAVRHARAENLWLEVERTDGGIRDPRPRRRVRGDRFAEASLAATASPGCASASSREAARSPSTRRRAGVSRRRHAAAAGGERVVVIRVFLVEDQTLVREGIRSLLALDPRNRGRRAKPPTERRRLAAIPSSRSRRRAARHAAAAAVGPRGAPARSPPRRACRRRSS